jgi:tetratricopeptide (TPR) repeat protein
MTLACLIALNRLKRDYQPSACRILSPVKIIALAITAVVAWAFFHYAVLPVGRSTSLLYQARDDYSAGLLDNTQVLLKKAAKEDTLNPHANLASGTLYLQYLDYYGPKQKEILALAEKTLLTAAERDRADFKPHEKLTAVYKLLADKSAAGAKSDYLHKSFDAASLAVKLYPGLGRLRINLAQIAEELGNTDVALEQYTKAVEIEDAYRAQFKTMYPDRELFSRLGHEKYDQAKKHITEIQP